MSRQAGAVRLQNKNKNKNDPLVFSAFQSRAARQRKNGGAAFRLKGLALNFDTLMVSRILDNILSYNVLLRHGNGIRTRYHLLSLQTCRVRLIPAEIREQDPSFAVNLSQSFKANVCVSVVFLFFFFYFFAGDAAVQPQPSFRSLLGSSAAEIR